MPSWSDVRVPEPECPLIMPCAAKKSLIFSRNMVTLLFSFGERDETKDEISGRTERTMPTRGAYLEPFGALLPKAETLKTETDARFASTLCIWPLITFLRKEREAVRDDEG
jgi:hypothetical protein